MNSYEVRIAEITIKNFKNVMYGSISLANGKKDYRSSILGLYGQNGSGKTALIDALELLKYALRGVQIPSKFADYINIDNEEAELEFTFELKEKDNIIQVSYKFSLRLYRDDSLQNSEAANSSIQEKKVVIVKEILKCPIISDKTIKIGRLLDSSETILTPEKKKNLLVGKDKSTDIELIVDKKLTYRESRSFLFSKELLMRIRNQVNGNLVSTPEKSEQVFYLSILESLVNYGNNCLFVINTQTSGVISLNAQPINFKFREEKIRAIGSIMLPLDRSILVPEEALSVIIKVFSGMNIVLEKIIPGLSISIKELGFETLPNGDKGCRIELMSQKNSKEIPLRNESEGIRKIVSILQLLIVVYNQSSITVAIDELDSGVFEYLLGEILKIIAEKGRGQLIFTSHNLRPLETLDKSFIAFTTTNSKNRYFRMHNVKGTNNLRDFYYRDIIIGDQKEELYEHTNNSEIALAFREAGSKNG